jgi:hypothetical protein
MSTLTTFEKGGGYKNQTLLDIIEGMDNFEALKKIAIRALKSNDMSYRRPLEWCPPLAWLEILKQMAEVIDSQTLFQIGKKMLETAIFPPQIKTIEEALSSMDMAYYMNHQSQEEIGHYHFIHIDDQSAKMVCTTPYSCELERGMINAVCQKFKSKEVAFVIVEHADKFPCRRKGADSCTYLVSWINSAGNNSRFEKSVVLRSPYVIV